MSALRELIQKVEAEPSVRHQATKALHKLCKEYVILLGAIEPLAEAADLDDALRGIRSQISDASKELAAVKADIAKATDRREQLDSKLTSLRADVAEAANRLDAATKRAAQMGDLTRAADEAERRLTDATRKLAGVEAQRKEAEQALAAFRKALGGA